MMRRHATSYLFVAAVLLCVALPYGALAQQTTDNAAGEIPARLRYLEGTVTVQRAAAGETEDAVVNLPLGSGDRVWSAEDGRVEIMFEDGTTLWLDARTTLDFVSLPRPADNDGAIIRLWTGSLFVQRPAAQGIAVPLRLDAPNGTVSLDEAGLFRIDIDDEQAVWLSVYDGAAVLTAGGLSERVTAGRRTLAQADSAPANAVAFNTSEIDDFTEWRDQRIALLADTRQYVEQRDYVPRTVAYYAADLEPYGSWGYNPTYSAWYWKPYAAVTWSPYSDGRWVYTYAGWSWVPSASWGWVTTHYGRWQYTSGGWIWFPGSVWAPASVSWYVGGDYIGWAPLNYWGRPAVDFGVYLGGGIGVSVNVSVGGYYGWPYYGYGYPYYGYSYWGRGRPYWGYRPYYGCCGYGWGGWGPGKPWRPGRPGHYPTPYRDRWAYNGNPIGSASGTGRVVKGRGYSSGLAKAWTMVPASELSSRSVGRTAVARTALPRGLDQSSKALVNGNLRARQPTDLLPSQVGRAQPGPTAGRRAVSAAGAPAAVNGASRATTAAPTGTARRAVPSTGQSRPAVSSPTRTPAARSSVRSTAPVTGATRSATSTRQATPRNGAVAPRATVPTPGGAARATTRARTAPTGSTRYPTTGAARYPTTGAARYPGTGATRPATTYPRSATAPRTPSPGSAGPSGSVRRASPSRPGTGARSAPTIQRVPTGRAPRTVRPAPSVGGARPSGGTRPSIGVRPSGSVRPSAGARPSGGVRPSAGARPSGGVRPSAGARPSGGVRPSAGARPSGGVRPSAGARPSGGVRPSAGARPSGGVRPPSASRPGGSVRPPAASRPGGGGRPAARPAKPKKPKGGSGS